MILFQVNLQRFTINEFKCDAPWAVHMNRVADRNKPPEAVKVETRQIKVIDLACGFKSIQTAEDTVMEPFINPRRSSLFPKF